MSKKKRFFSPAFTHKKKATKNEHYKEGDVAILVDRDNKGRVYAYAREIDGEEISEANAIWTELRQQAKRELNNQSFKPKGFTDPTMTKIEQALNSSSSFSRYIERKTGIKLN